MSELKNSSYFMSEDFPRKVVFNRKKLLPIFSRARKSLGKNEVSLKGDKLKISGTEYTVNNLMNLEGELNPRAFSRKSNEEVVVFGGVFSETESLSNWEKSPFVYEGTRYASLEQGYMYTKAVMNGDVTSANEIMRTSEPYRAKEIGDKITTKRGKWTHDQCEDVMTNLLAAKFAPGSKRAADLLATGSKYLAETGRNTYYACGLPINHREVLNKQAHTGKNRLGHLLMKIRSSLSNNTN